MGIGTIHTAGPIVVSGTGAFNLDGIESFSVDPGLQEVLLTAGGYVDPSYVATMANAPMFTATVSDLATLLGTAALSGMQIPQSTTITTTDVYFTKVAEGGTRAGATSHLKVTINEGLMLCQSISWSQGQHATAQVEIHTTYDGTNAPLVYTASQSLPHTPVIGEAFTGGKITINGTVLNGVTSCTINFGYQVIKESSGGELYPTFVAIGQRNPRIEITTKEVPSLSTFGLNGTAQTASDSVIYLTKIDENGTRVADGTAEHISFTIDDGEIWCGAFGGGNNDSHEGRVIIQPTYDGTNAIMVISAATAIT